MRSWLLLLVCACSSSSNNNPDASIDAPDVDAATEVTFKYAPGWSGVQSVAVVGGFGQSTDWSTPIASLTDDGSGMFTGTAVLPAGTYAYLFDVVGDADAGGKALTLQRYAIDPSNDTAMMCPAASPSAMQNPENPCSQLTVPTAGTPTLYHVHGRVLADASPVSTWLVVLERDDAGAHHYFANRVTTGTDGSYDLLAAAGSYRVQIQNPEYEAKSDAQVDPATHPVVRRLLSASFAVAGDVAVPDAEVAYHDYAAFAPKATATLPTTFTFANSPARPTRLEVYGTGNAGAGNDIGDPWFSSPATTGTTATFNGTFTTMQAKETTAALGERYFWGIEQNRPGAIAFTAQTLVSPITWH